MWLRHSAISTYTHCYHYRHHHHEYQRLITRRKQHTSEAPSGRLPTYNRRDWRASVLRAGGRVGLPMKPGAPPTIGGNPAAAATAASEGPGNDPAATPGNTAPMTNSGLAPGGSACPPATAAAAALAAACKALGSATRVTPSKPGGAISHALARFLHDQQTKKEIEEIHYHQYTAAADDSIH